MAMRYIGWCLTIITLSMLETNAGAADPDPIAAALAYQLPRSECQAPRLRQGARIQRDTRTGTGTLYDVDSYQLGRHERGLKRYRACQEAHLARLQEDFNWLQASANYGLSRDEAHKILGHMAEIQREMRLVTQSSGSSTTR